MPTQQQARESLEKLIAQYHSKDKDKALSESDVIQKYVEPLLEDVLGWPIRDSDRYLREVHTVAGRPDLRLTAANKEVLYVEAKRFGVIEKLEKIEATRYIAEIRRAEESLHRRMTDAIGPQQMALPSMAVDRTQEEQQAINYAFKNGGQWAILTNFERLRLFNARRDWLVLSFENPEAFLHDFDLLWEISYERILAGSLDYLSNQRYRENIDPDYLKLINTWRMELANDIVKQPEKNAWIHNPQGAYDLPLIRGVVQRMIDRMVIARFAEDHLVIKPGTLFDFYELRRTNPYTQAMNEYLNHYFRRFDEDHNSALFAHDVVDTATFSDAVLMPLLNDLYRVKFRAMPADILGNTYEQYLGKALDYDGTAITTRDNLETRKKQGSYYTPQVIVRYIVDNSLGRYLYGTANGKPDGEPVTGETRKTSRDIMDLRVLDSACGSGSFLIYAYEVLRDFYKAEFERLNSAYVDGVAQLAQKFGNTTLEEEVAVKQYEIERDRIRHYPRIILETHLYGVDLDPQAAEIAVVNLMMRALEGQNGEKRLPLILNQNVKIGNSLIGLRPDDPRLRDHAATLATIRQLRLDLKETSNNDPAHQRIMDDLERETRTLYAAFEADYSAHFDDVERVRLFHWAVEFPECFVDAAGQLLEKSGFQVIIGNPPWEIVKPDLREFYAQFDENIESRLSRAQAEKRIAELDAEDPKRQQLWAAQTQNIEQQAAYYRATAAYTKQGRGDTATHKLFMERAYAHLLACEGRLGYVVPAGIYKDLGTKELREMVLNTGSFDYIYAFSNVRWFFPGVSDRVQFAVMGIRKNIKSDGLWATFRFNPRVAVAPDDFPAFVANEDNLVYIKTSALDKFSPDSLSLMEFQTQHDYNVTAKAYEGFPLLGDALENCWNIKLSNEFHMTNDRHLFNTNGGKIAVYNGRMIHQFDSAFAPHEFWIADSKVNEISQDKQEQVKYFRLSYRRIARPTDSRTLIGAVVAPNTICDTVALVETDHSQTRNAVALYLASMFNSLCMDYILRHKIATTVNMFYVYQLPMPRLVAGNPYFDALVVRAACLTCVRAEFADLWQAVMGSAWVSPQLIATGGLNPVVDGAGRQVLRDEIDALVAHLYGLARDEFAHILGTFPLVFPDNEAGQTKKAQLLAVYDAFAATVQGWSRG